jgi:hypothetical protein
MSNYQTPTSEQVRTAILRLTSYQIRRVFYEGLKNPLWAKPLTEAGAFAYSPDPELQGSDAISGVFWPEISYLINAAKEAPSDVVDVLLSLKDSRNSWIRRAVFTIGSQIPADQAVRLKALTDAWASTGLGWRTDPHDLVAFATNLLNGGQTEFGVSFANTLFRPRDIGADKNDSVSELQEYWYSEELPTVVNALGELALQTVLPWLVTYEKNENNIKDGFDHSGFGRSLIESQPDNHYQIHDALIDAVRDAATERLSADPEDAWELLNRDPILITRRITLYVIARLLEKLEKEGVDESKLIRIACELLVDLKCRNEYARIEFVGLAKVVGRLAPSELELLVQVINEGQFTTDDLKRMKRNMKARDESDEEIEASIQRWDENWRHQILAGIGRELLPQTLQERLDALNAAQGELEHPLTPSFLITSWVGPNSPSTKDEMVVLSATELLSQLESWHDTGNGWGPEPSHEGQARVLIDVLTANPMALSGTSHLAERLRPTYLRAILNGWEAAYKADLDLDWQLVAETLTDVVRHGYESKFPSEGDRNNDDPDFKYAKQSAVSLLEEFAKRKKEIQEVPADILARVAELLIKSAEDETSWIDYSVYEHKLDSEMDPLTLSLNRQWPIMVRGLINLVAHGEGATWYFEALTALEQQLQRTDESGASRAVLGEGIGKLFTSAPEWLHSHLAQYFGTEVGLTKDQQIALSTAIAMHYYHPELYKLLTGPMIAALRSEEELEVGWGNGMNPRERIGQWVIQAIIRGRISSADPLYIVFYNEATPEDRGKAIGHTAWSFMHAEAVDDSIRDRLAVLWDERVQHVEQHPDDKAELKDFYWFVRSGKFEQTWWVPRLKRALELNPDVDTNDMISEQLAEAARNFPRETLDVLVLLIRAEDTPMHDNYMLQHEALAPVIAAALDSGDKQLIKDASSFMNEMGAKGEIDLEARVLQLRTSTTN